MSDDFLKEIQFDFIREAEELLDKSESLFVALEKAGTDKKEIFDSLKRLAHNFKGSGKAVGFDDLSKFCHAFENLLVALASGKLELNPTIVDLLLLVIDTLKDDLANLKNDLSADCRHPDIVNKLELAQENGLQSSAKDEPVLTAEALANDPSGPTFVKDAVLAKQKPVAAKIEPTKKKEVDDLIRIPLARIDELLNSFGEQVIHLSALDFYKNDMVTYKDEIVRSVFALKKMAFDLQRSTLNLRMVSLKQLFSKLERVIRDSAKATGKNIICVMNGAEQELDKAIVDQLSDPLVHMIRNAVDHGIEDEKDRLAAGKTLEGYILMRARAEGGSFVIEIQDDGKGMNPEKIRQKAVSVGLISADAVLSKSETLDLIFQNGFSTKEQVSEISGRGVGMNVVKEMILALKGSYEIESEVGEGTTFRIKLPLSLSLFNGLIVGVDGQKFIIPCSQISEVVDFQSIEIRESQPNHRVIQLRDEVIDAYDLGPILARKGTRAASRAMVKKDKSLVMVVEIEKCKFAFIIDEIFSIQRVVQKKLSPELKVCDGAVGVSILGDGSPAMILDMRSLSVVANRQKAGSANDVGSAA